MTPLDEFWRFVAHRPGLGATGVEWRGVLGDSLWGALRPRMFVGDGVAASCRHASGGRPLRVVPHSSGYQLVCTATGEVEAEGVPEDDVRCYRLDLPAIRGAIAKALGIEPDPGAVRDAPRAFPLGEWQPVEGVSLPAFMVFPPTSKALRAEMQRLLLEARDGFILLVPDSPRLDRPTRDLLVQKKATVLALAEVLEWDGTAFCASATWHTYRDAYCRKHLADRMVPAPPQFEWRKAGDYWSIRYAGEFTTVKDAVGLAYIAQLLPRPRQKVFAPDLLEAISGQTAVKQTGSAGEQTDKQTLDEVKQKYLDAQTDLEEAERNNDLAAQDRLQRELDDLTDYLKSVKGFGGRTREASDDADKIRRAMTQAIGRVTNALAAEDKLPAAALHLKNSLKTGLFMSYEPEEELPWNL